MKRITQRELMWCFTQCRRPDATDQSLDAALIALLNNVNVREAAKRITVFLKEPRRCKHGIIGCRMGHSCHVH
jgi:hypothetical protein